MLRRDLCRAFKKQPYQLCRLVCCCSSQWVYCLRTFSYFKLNDMEMHI